MPVQRQLWWIFPILKRYLFWVKLNMIKCQKERSDLMSLPVTWIYHLGQTMRIRTVLLYAVWYARTSVYQTMTQLMLCFFRNVCRQDSTCIVSHFDQQRKLLYSTFVASATQQETHGRLWPLLFHAIAQVPGNWPNNAIGSPDTVLYIWDNMIGSTLVIYAGWV